MLEDENELRHVQHAPHIVPDCYPPHIRYTDRAERLRELRYNSLDLRYDSRWVHATDR